jgi:hypothetical protein
MLQVLLKKIVNRLQRIFIRRGIKIKGAPKEMIYRIGDKELVGRSSISSERKVNSAEVIWSGERSRFNGRSFVRMLFVRHGESIVDKRVKIVFTDFLVGDVDLAVELGKAYVDPVRIFSFLLKEKGVFDDLAISRIFERIRVRRVIE